MDLISPGLRSRSSKSIKLIKEINNNNIISLKLKKKFKILNRSTIELVSTELINYSTIHPESVDDNDLNTLQEVFQKLYYLLEIDQFNFNRVSTINLNQLQALHQRLEHLSIKNELSKKINQLINDYLVLIIKLNLSNSLIFQALVLKNQLIYWENLNNSRVNKVIYFVQISPIKLFDFFKVIVNHSKELFRQQQEIELITYRSITEEDNLLYHNYQKLKKFSFVLIESLKSSINKLINQNPSILLIKLSHNKFFKGLKLLYKSPIRLINNEIFDKISLINSQIEENSSKIDRLINNEDHLSSFEYALNFNVHDNDYGSTENKRINRILKALAEFDSSKLDAKTDKPSFLTRYWPLILLLINYGPSSSTTIYNNRFEILDWLKYNFIDTIYGFYKNWLIKPINNMLNTLRHDDELTITSKESLKSDLDSLERMLIDFIVDENGDNVNKQEIHNSIQNGDLTMLMSKYEKEIRNPFKSIVKGSLIRSLLIQLQKTKVDGAIALNGIDKLLKSQQLVFGIVSVSPSILIVYKVWSYLTTAKPIIINGKNLNLVCLKSLSNIENLIINYNNEFNVEGKLLVEIINLIIISGLIIPKQLKNEWIKDLNELNNNAYTNKIKLKIINKIWNVYGPYFR